MSRLRYRAYEGLVQLVVVSLLLTSVGIPARAAPAALSQEGEPALETESALALSVSSGTEPARDVEPVEEEPSLLFHDVATDETPTAWAPQAAPVQQEGEPVDISFSGPAFQCEAGQDEHVTCTAVDDYTVHVDFWYMSDAGSTNFEARWPISPTGHVTSVKYSVEVVGGNHGIATRPYQDWGTDPVSPTKPEMGWHSTQACLGSPNYYTGVQREENNDSGWYWRDGKWWTDTFSTPTSAP